MSMPRTRACVHFLRLLTFRTTATRRTSLTVPPTDTDTHKHCSWVLAPLVELHGGLVTVCRSVEQHFLRPTIQLVLFCVAPSDCQ